MACYLVRAGETDRVKIGFAAIVARRIQHIQAGNAERLSLLRTWEGGRSFEALLHRHFAGHRISREWFTFDAEMLTVDAATLAVVTSEKEFHAPRYGYQKKRPEPTSFHACLIRDLGGKAKLADALGLDRDVLTKWHIRGIPSKYWHRVVKIGTTYDPPVHVSAVDLERTKPETSRIAADAA